MESGLTGNGVETLHGTATNTIDIDGAARESSHFMIATGARPKPLGFPGAINSSTAPNFLNLEELPARILFIGGGFISFEFAHIAARAGSRPVIVDRGERPLKGFDPDLVELLITRSSEVGIDVQRKSVVTAIQPQPSGWRVTKTHLACSMIGQTDASPPCDAPSEHSRARSTCSSSIRWSISAILSSTMASTRPHGRSPVSANSNTRPISKSVSPSDFADLMNSSRSTVASS